MASDAIGIDVVSRVVGYLLKKGNFLPQSPNLPMRIAILGEANTANQSTLDVSQGKEITSLKQIGDLYGYGSPLHMIGRILKPVFGNGVGSIPIIIYPQAAAGGAVAKVVKVAVTGTPTANGTHYLKIAGRKAIDGQTYALTITTDDTASTIHTKMENAVNNMLASPMSAQAVGGYEALLTSKWKGKTAQDINVSVDTGDDALGLTYTVTELVTAVGTPSITNSLNLFSSNWNTIVLNSYGFVSTILDALEAYNGIALETNPTGRYQSTIWKPFIAFTGTVLDYDGTSNDPSVITDARKSNMTIAACPAPLSPAMPFEAAANYVLLEAVQAQSDPSLGIQGKSLPDMPLPANSNIGVMKSFSSRDSIVKKGCSTVDLVSGAYQIQDFVTTYHPTGETVPQYRYVRDLILDWNVRFGYLLKEQQFVVDKVIANDNDTVESDNVVKPKTWKAEVATYVKELVSRGLVVDTAFSIESITVNISSTNPNRIETFFKYKRSGVAIQSATTAEAGFNYGTLNA